jgi:DNA-binding IscR family transcriptional regulator
VLVARRLVEAQGSALAFEQLRLDTGIPKRELADTLERLVAQGIVARDGEGFALARPPEAISLGALYGVAGRAAARKE